MVLLLAYRMGIREANPLEYRFGSVAGSARIIFIGLVPVQFQCFIKLVDQVWFECTRVKFWRFRCKSKRSGSSLRFWFNDNSNLILAFGLIFGLYFLHVSTVFVFVAFPFFVPFIYEQVLLKILSAVKIKRNRIILKFDWVDNCQNLGCQM